MSLRAKRAFQALGALAAAAAVVFAALLLRGTDAAALLRWTPRRPAAAAAFLLAVFAVKGFTFVLPMAVPAAAAGLLFPLPWALGLSAAGAALAMTPPYLLGRRRQGGLAALERRYPALGRARELGLEGGGFFSVFLVRLTGVLPCDAVSLLLGAAGVPARIYFGAGLLGAAPHLAAAAVLGSALSDPFSETFFISAAANAAVSVAALAVRRVWRRHARGT